MFQVLISESINTGLAKFLIIEFAVEIIVNVGIITSSFFFNSKLLTAISKAAVPLDTAQAYFLDTIFAKLTSNFLRFFTQIHQLY